MLDHWWIWPLAICLIQVGIHGYLGIHVITRKVIFVDLAMAQIAALGATYAFVLGYDPSNPADAMAVYLFSLAFAIAGAAVFAFTRMRQEKVPQEAFIGIVYASATAIAILILAKSPHGGEQIRHMLEGNIILVKWETVAKTAAIYSVIGIFHWVFRKRFFQITWDHEAAEKEGINVRWWDFLFYATFGVVITSSVAVAGVLLVFSYLVVPAAVAVLFAERVRARVVVAWMIGAVVTIGGIILSYHGGFPTGPAVVATFAAVLAIAGIVHYLCHAPSWKGSLLRLAGGVAIAGALLGLSFLLRKTEEHGHHKDEFTAYVDMLHSGDEVRQIDAIHHLVDMMHPIHTVPEMVRLLQSTKSDHLIEHLAKGLAKLGDPTAVPALVDAAGKDIDGFLRITLAESILALHDPGGFRILVDVAAKDEAQLVRKKAAEILGPDRLTESWWTDKGRHLKWREATRRFE